jgi:hypothetical protein
MSKSSLKSPGLKACRYQPIPKSKRQDLPFVKGNERHFDKDRPAAAEDPRRPIQDVLFISLNIDLK